ncbi:MAG TPA: superoxide dismutase family protein, partial [Longimicrobiales bacterium]|nr:superoxide dismutase family protein [Longimicrobiales bacterium]
MRTIGTLLILLLLAPLPAHAQRVATARLVDAGGRPVGEAHLTQTPHSGVLIHLRLHNLPAGVHAFHVHAVGRCEGPDFESAGPHLNPAARAHGLLVADGPHAGDMPNVYVGPDGTLEAELVAARLSLRRR